MANSKKNPKRKTAKKAGRHPSALICDECGFKAAHAMGLGRHRTAIHGVPSKRERAERLGKSSDTRRVARLERRVADLERRYESLITGLRKTAGGARSK